MRARGAVAYAGALIVVLCLGLWLGGHPAQLPGFLRDAFVGEPAGLSAEAAELIEDSYFRPVAAEELSNATLQGMARELRRRHDDRFTEYFSPEARESFDQQIEGRFTGIGLSVVPVERGLRITRVYPGSPAAGAGLRAGETIVSVEGDSIAGQGSNEATAKIKGPEGSEVTVGVLDAEGERVRQETMTRAEVTLPNVSSRVIEVDGRRLGYVRLLSFSRGAGELLADAVGKVQRQGAAGIVLDLRGNPGGLLDEAVSSASVFLPEGEVVVRTESRSEGTTVHRTSGENLPPLPMVVLVNGGTASAAEILAAALVDGADAEVVGSSTFGKGLFQEERPLANGGALKLSVGEYFTPAGVNLAESDGIRPEVRASDDPETKPDEALRRALGTLAGRVGG